MIHDKVNQKKSYQLMIIRGLKYITNDFATVIFVCVIYFIYIIYFFLKNTIDTIGTIQCYENPSSFNEIIIYLFIGLSIVIAMVDISLNAKLCATQWREFWYKYDPFFIRLQQLMLPLVIFLWFMGNLFGIFRVDIYELIFPDDFYLYGDVVDMIIQSLNQYAQTFYFSGFLILVTLLKRIRDRYRHKDQQCDTLAKAFSKKNIYKQFRKFCENEWSLENILMYEDVLKYERLEEIDRRECSQRIFSSYMNGNLSDLEVNLPGSVCRSVKEKIDNFAVELTPNLFDEAMMMVKNNLSDTYSRFIISDDYLKLMNSLEFIRIEASTEELEDLPIHNKI
jgi:hypothetical protein